MRKANERTSRLRVAIALVFAFVLPSLGLGQAGYWLDANNWASLSIPQASSVALGSMLFGVLLGWPFVFGAAAAWGVLARFHLHHSWAASLVGMATGAMAAWAMQSLKLLTPEQAIWPVSLALGVITGLGVWWIAYGRQHRLKPVSTPTR